MESTITDANKKAPGKTTKHLRVNAACDECRSRKVRCDARKPVCSPCSRKNGPSSCYWGMRRRRGPGSSRMRLQHSSIYSSGDHPRGESNSPPPELPCPESEHANAVNAMMGWTEEGIQTSPNASISSFLHQIRNAMTSDSRQARRAHTHPVDNYRSKSNRSLFDMDFVLPPRQTADHLFETYWHLLATLYPFLDRDEVSASYDALWTGKPLGDNGPIFVCLLNALFAITTLVDPAIRPEERVSRGDIFYKRARGSLDVELTQNRSVLAVQCFLLFGQYLQSTSASQECWYFIGLAVRTAQSIGLDLPSLSARAEDAKRKNLLRRVWYGCILMDRVLSMIFGRPGIITYQPIVSVPLPEPHFDNSQCSCFTSAASLEPDLGGSHFFIESVKLYEMIGGTLLTIYSPGTQDEGSNDDPYAPYFGSTGIKAAQTILEVDSKLWLWHLNLPFHLRQDVNIEKSAMLLRRSNILHLRYCHVRVLLFRPVLSRLCSQPDNCNELSTSTMWYKLAIHCSTICVESACEIINFFATIMEDESLDGFESFLPFWWYSTYYVYTAGMVLLAERLTLRKTSEVAEVKIRDRWKSAILILRRFEPYGSHVKQSITSLMTILERVRHRRAREESCRRQHRTYDHQQPSSARQHSGGNQIRYVQDTADTTDRSIIGNDHIHEQMELDSVQDPPPVDISLSGWLDEPYHLAVGAEDILLDTSPDLDFFTIPDFELDPSDMSWLQMPFALGNT